MHQLGLQLQDLLHLADTVQGDCGVQYPKCSLCSRDGDRSIFLVRHRLPATSGLLLVLCKYFIWVMTFVSSES